MSPKKNILVIGDIMVDHYIYGKCDRISPEAPVPVVNFTQEHYTLGGAGNVVKNLIALEAPTQLLAACGTDEAASQLEDQLHSSSITYFLAKEKDRPTTVKTRVLAGNHQLLRIDRETKKNISVDGEEKLIGQLTALLPHTQLLILSDYCKGFFSDGLSKAIISACKQHQVLTILDSKEKNLEKFAGIDIIKPNKKEAALMSGITIVDQQTLREACARIREKTQCQSVVVTLSEEGMAIYHQENLDIIPTKALEVYDVTGAGDTVIAAIAYGLAEGLSLHEACDLANHAAAVVVAKIGSATATLKEIEQLRKKQEQ
ncbi:D-glycero-beta-D-manno-heptose-7-phosphate kinase [Olivibacter ginsenosidimutans]|uniref:D-glycero-beta-D-manno-heptose-7-phosphate kinase n=1 Tax=Olivibacter ginsenosidimutans TaxID=1176537 RepID=A0ABP9AHI9_9SPHI